MSAVVQSSLTYLSSQAALDSLARDPYWPKWDSPWWHMTLLWELGLAERIPKPAVASLTRSIGSRYLKIFPTSPEELPAGTDPYRDIACHCALGTAYQLLTACGVDVDSDLPWVRPWFLKYQLPDGGLNCDDQAYAKERPKSSVVSSLPPLEAVLLCTPRPFTSEEASFLDRGAAYLAGHRLFRSADGTRILDQGWLKPRFPRFYEYDLLRGYAFLRRWSRMRGKTFPTVETEEAATILETLAAGGLLV
ncbi:MAG: hypothetical protein HYV15_08240, partial [Elusimicrobia bacterium]|nr:hypothetical protein [Elusimicrobiota bacterium]